MADIIIRFFPRFKSYFPTDALVYNSYSNRAEFNTEKEFIQNNDNWIKLASVLYH